MALIKTFVYIRRYKALFLATLALTAAAVAFTLVQVDFIRQSVDAALAGDWQRLLLLAGLFVLITAAQLTRNFLFGLAAGRIDACLARDMKNDLTRAVLEADMAFALSQPTGELLIRHNDDISAVAGFIRNGFTRFLLDPLMALGGFVYLMCFNCQLSLLTFAATPLLTLLLYRRAGRAGRLHARQMEQRGVFLEQAYDAVQAAETVRAYNMRPFLAQKVQRMLNSLYSTEIDNGRNDAVTTGLILAVAYVPAVLALLFGAGLIMRGALSVSVLFAYAQLISVINTPAISLFSSFKDMKNAARSMERVDHLLSATLERTGGDASAPPVLKVRPGVPAVELEGLYFNYAQEAAVLSGVSLTIPAGTRVGLTGESGAGKTTLIHLLCGFFPAKQGAVRVMGRDVADWDLAALRRQIAYVSQDSAVIPGTLADNIRYGDPDADDAAVCKAAEMAELAQFDLQKPLAENGANLSGGQRQRVGLARALLKNAPLYILDEPTASLDPETEAFVLRRLLEMTDGKTLLVISHNPAALAACDEIYVLRGGAIVKTDEARHEKNL